MGREGSVHFVVKEVKVRSEIQPGIEYFIRCGHIALRVNVAGLKRKLVEKI